MMAAASRPLVGLPPPPPLGTIAVVALCHGAFLLWTGVQFGSDSANYGYWSWRLVDSGFDVPNLLSEANSQFPALLYALFATLLALLRLIAADDWSSALVAVNFVAHVGLAVLIVRLSLRATGSCIGAWTALFLFLGCYEIVRWVPFVLSDSTFVFLAFSVFSLAAARILDEAKGWLPVAVPAALGVFYRPTGLVLVPDLLWAAYLSRRAALTYPLRTAAFITVLVAMTVLAFAWVVLQPERWPFEVLARSFAAVAQGYALGEVVSARPATWHAPPNDIADILLISADRFLHFFAIGAHEYSFQHWLISAFFFVPCYCLALWLLFVLWRGDTAYAPRQRRVFLAAAGAILSYALFHALVQIDFDWRYRLPVLPHMILLASAGASDVVRRVVRS